MKVAKRARTLGFDQQRLVPHGGHLDYFPMKKPS